MDNQKKKCPRCGDEESQKLDGKNRSGTQRCLCKLCKVSYTLNPKDHRIPEHIRKIAIREYYAGISGRMIGKIHNMSSNNVMRWILAMGKKNSESVD